MTPATLTRAIPGLMLAFFVNGVEADWHIEPFARTSLLFDDNIRFSSSDPTASTGFFTAAGVSFKNESDAIKTNVSPRIAYRGYVEDSDLGTFDQFLDFSTTSFGERSDLGLKLRFANDSTLTSEEEDSGITFLNKRRRFMSMEPSWRYLLSPLTSVNVRYRFDGLQYEDSGEFGLNDYDFQVATGDFERRLAEDKDFVVRAYYQRYNVVELTNKATSTGLELGYKQRFSPQVRGSVFVGGVSTESTIAGKTDNSSGVSASVNIAYDAERTRLDARYEAGVAPSSTGEVFLQNRLVGSVRGSLTAKLSWGIGVTVQDRSTINDNSTQPDRTYFRIEPGLGWKLNREWAMRGRYTYAGERRENGDVKRNQVYVGVEYRKAASRLY